MDFSITPIHKDDEAYLVEYAKLYQHMVPKIKEKIPELAVDFQRNISAEERGHPGLGPTTYLAYTKDQDTINGLGYGMIQIRTNDGEIISHLYSHIYVLPEHRRRGIGTALLHVLLSTAKNIPQVKVIFFFAEDEGTEAFLRSHGGKSVDRGMTYKLEISETVLEQARQLYEEKHGDIRITIIENPTREQLAEFVNVYNESNIEAPRDDATYDPAEHSLEGLVELFSMGGHDSVGAFGYYQGVPVGISQLMLLSHLPQQCYQKHTGVIAKATNFGIATAMKARMILWLAEERPERTVIRTEVLDSNKSMRRVNEKVGFQPEQLQVTVEFDVGS